VLKRFNHPFPSAPLNTFQPDEAKTRQQAIAQAAYYRAQARGFAPGRALDDWLEAEREIAAHGHK